MKRHSDHEIAAILQRARDLEQAGRLQSDICEMFDISVMTLHRWRKMERTSVNAAAAKLDIEENRLLRKIAFDLLLEIAAMKEGLEGLEGKRAA